MSITQPVREVTWGSAAASGNISEPSDGMKAAGFTGTPAPVYQYVNWLFNKLSSWVSYLRARGIPDYDPLETYRKDDRVNYLGWTYRRWVTGDTTGVDPTDTTKWQLWGYNADQLDDEFSQRVAPFALASDSDVTVTGITGTASLEAGSVTLISHGSSVANGAKQVTCRVAFTADVGTHASSFSITLSGSCAMGTAIKSVVKSLQSTAAGQYGGLVYSSANVITVATFDCPTGEQHMDFVISGL